MMVSKAAVIELSDGAFEGMVVGVAVGVVLNALLGDDEIGSVGSLVLDSIGHDVGNPVGVMEVEIEGLEDGAIALGASVIGAFVGLQLFNKSSGAAVIGILVRLVGSWLVGAPLVGPELVGLSLVGTWLEGPKLVGERLTGETVGSNEGTSVLTKSGLLVLGDPVG